jgi:hypothetical protein
MTGDLAIRVAQAWAVAAGLQFVLWLIQQRTRNAGIVDVGWAIAFTPVVAVVAWRATTRIGASIWKVTGIPATDYPASAISTVATSRPPARSSHDRAAADGPVIERAFVVMLPKSRYTFTSGPVLGCGVAYFMSTELGRDLPLEDWIGFHRDRLLSVLYQMKEMGVPDPGFDASMIEGVTGLPRAHADQLAQQLLDQGLLARDGHTYRLTETGARWVLESPGR